MVYTVCVTQVIVPLNFKAMTGQILRIVAGGILAGFILFAIPFFLFKVFFFFLFVSLLFRLLGGGGYRRWHRHHRYYDDMHRYSPYQEKENLRDYFNQKPQNI